MGIRKFFKKLVSSRTLPEAIGLKQVARDALISEFPYNESIKSSGRKVELYNATTDLVIIRDSILNDLYLGKILIILDKESRMSVLQIERLPAYYPDDIYKSYYKQLEYELKKMS